MKGGLDIVTGGTDTHLMLVDLRPKGVTGKDAEAALGRAHITCNKNGIPFDPQPPTVTSGVRLGTPAGTTRGFGARRVRRDRRDDRRGRRRAGATAPRATPRSRRRSRPGSGASATASRSTRGSERRAPRATRVEAHLDAGPGAGSSTPSRAPGSPRRHLRPRPRAASQASQSGHQLPGVSSAPFSHSSRRRLRHVGIGPELVLAAAPAGSPRRRCAPSPTARSARSALPISLAPR